VLYSGFLIKEQIGSERDAELAAYRLWLAQYSDAPEWPTATWPAWWLWQYTDQGTIDGIVGDVDLNAYNAASRLRAEWLG
jgi:lysozyme